MNKRLFTIKEVSLRTGLSTQLLRKWEERYGVVSPSRFPNGYRGYTKEHVETFLWLKSRVDAGVPIGLAVQDFLAGGIPSQQREPEPAAAPARRPAAMTEAEEYRRSLIAAWLELDASAAARLLNRLAGLHRLEFVFMQVLLPALAELGDMRQRGETTEYHEIFGILFARDRLLSTQLLFDSEPGAPCIVTAVSPYDKHELDSLLFGCFAMQAGLRVVRLGHLPSEKVLLECLRLERPRALVLSAPTQQAHLEWLPLLAAIDRDIASRHAETRAFIIGGFVKEDAVVPGTRSVYLSAGQGREVVLKIKSMVMP